MIQDAYGRSTTAPEKRIGSNRLRVTVIVGLYLLYTIRTINWPLIYCERELQLPVSLIRKKVGGRRNYKSSLFVTAKPYGDAMGAFVVLGRLAMAKKDDVVISFLPGDQGQKTSATTT